ncbi:Carbonic anhydrase 1 [Eumeta japonica]|uniref:Carbonic anhydrase 1 n=1 Tax=Eumeta variegata TaxID=151549 RepID=A0A4C1TTX7_EUMVA|nr:Carbonic anhydrase 1 [Eumeta japonica]
MNKQFGRRLSGVERCGHRRPPAPPAVGSRYHIHKSKNILVNYACLYCSPGAPWSPEMIRQRQYIFRHPISIQYNSKPSPSLGRIIFQSLFQIEPYLGLTEILMRSTCLAKLNEPKHDGSFFVVSSCDGEVEKTHYELSVRTHARNVSDWLRLNILLKRVTVFPAHPHTLFTVTRQRSPGACYSLAPMTLLTSSITIGVTRAVSLDVEQFHREYLSPLPPPTRALLVALKLSSRSKRYSNKSNCVFIAGQISRLRASQSPIAISLQRCPTWTSLEPLQFARYWHNDCPATLLNTGQTAYFTFEGAPERRPQLSGGPLIGQYVFEQMHFHWSVDDFTGCEHVLDGHGYARPRSCLHSRSRTASASSPFYAKST